jgi:hypothetical protein
MSKKPVFPPACTSHHWTYQRVRPTPPEGYQLWLDSPPPLGHILISLWSPGWSEGLPILVYRDELAPEFNLNGVYWKLTGIGREQENGLPQFSSFNVRGRRSTNLTALLPTEFLPDSKGGPPPGYNYEDK